ncbi:MAG: NAD(P)H-dependent oxidoreductase [Saprospiraceae bacterium]|nr:NAD(P)H-dependent oxidoreductase [Saprospiraceae bacterium]
MICVISGTNRLDSKTREISKLIVKTLQELQDEKVIMIDLKEIPSESLSNMMYSKSGQDPWVTDIQDKYILPSDKWLIITPEYNGSFAGVLKVFIDALSVRHYNETFNGKFVGLVGISSGRAGNLRGMEHLTGILQYLKMHVFHDKLPISRIETVVSEDGQVDEETATLITQMLEGYLEFTPASISY